MARRAGLLALFALTLSQYALAHKANVKLPDSAWFQDDPSHPVHELFKRAPSDVGSESWFSSLPAVGKPLDLSKIPKEWTYALANAMKAGKIPDIPVSAMVPPEATEGVPVYPNGITRGNTTVCSSTDLCKNTQMGDVWEAPGGVYAIGFDDGPSPHSPLLLDFAKKEKQQMCHFVIGHYIVEYPKEFKLMVESGGDLAVHTWTHRHMTTLNNLELLAEFGFTMEAIRISSGGKIPKFWRAPYGDSDNRVRAIAMEIFGLRNVMWSHDTNDWKLAVAAASTDKSAIVTAQADIDTLFTTWASGPKNPGLLVLEHETTELSINSFIKAYPALKQNQWNILSAARMENTGGSSGPYREATNILNAGVNTASADTSALAAMNTGVSGGSSLNPTNPQGGNGNAGLRAESPVFAVAGSIFVAILGAAFTL